MKLSQRRDKKNISNKNWDKRILCQNKYVTLQFEI